MMRPNLSVVAVAIGLFAGAISINHSTAVAKEHVPPTTLPLAATPTMKEAFAAYDRRDYKTALALFQREANPAPGRPNNPLAQLFAARLFWAGQGVPEGNWGTVLHYLKLVFQTDDPGMRSVGLNFVKEIYDNLKDYPDRNERQIIESVENISGLAPPHALKAPRAPQVRNVQTAPSNHSDGMGLLEGWELHELWGD